MLSIQNDVVFYLISLIIIVIEFCSTEIKNKLKRKKCRLRQGFALHEKKLANQHVRQNSNIEFKIVIIGL